MKKKRLAAVAILAGLVAVGAGFVALGPNTSSPAQATATTVNISNNFYSNTTSDDCGSPCVTNIGVGDTVHWVWLVSATHTHSTTSDGVRAQVWDSGISGPAFTFDQTFNTPGSYSYHCRVHSSMHGTIVVGGGGSTATPMFTRTLTPVTTPTPAGLVGDANKDGHVDSIDAAIVLQYAAGLIPYINALADANQNGQTNAIDATLILQYVAGLLSHLPP